MASGEPAAALGVTMAVMVKREVIAACMTCPLCKKLLRNATTVSECLHTFCRKCIFEKLSDEEVDCCPVCNIDLGCAPLEKLRPDHNLQDVRTKIFPFKRRKVEAPEVVSPIMLPIKRKERSLSSLVVNTPQVSTQTSLTGRRTKSVARRVSALRGLGPIIKEPVKKENDTIEKHADNSSPSDTLRKMTQTRRQTSSIAEPSNHPLNNDIENGEHFLDKTELWKPLNCLVEAANRTKSLKSSPRSPVVKTEQLSGFDGDEQLQKAKVREHPQKFKIQHEKNGTSSMPPIVKNRRARAQGISRKRREPGGSIHAMLHSASSRQDRKFNPIWFSLVASFDQKGDPPLPQIPTNYLRIKDGNVPASFIIKYLVQKLNLSSEAEVEITCRGQTVSPTLALHCLTDLWLRWGSTQKVQASVGTSAKEFVMVLTYGRPKSSVS
ncbi:E3 ubiquitin protein ligase DRIP2-like isoform X1 [Typha latifolia]|uniref:E3 ubiquitin protein ligase DRIP2-like isoform X1 n=1 Tax=Typha latifolia TaxID=4733 RepID=UPI003C2D09C2